MEEKGGEEKGRKREGKGEGERREEGEGRGGGEEKGRGEKKGRGGERREEGEGRRGRGGEGRGESKVERRKRCSERERMPLSLTYCYCCTSRRSLYLSNTSMPSLATFLVSRRVFSSPRCSRWRAMSVARTMSITIRLKACRCAVSTFSRKLQFGAWKWWRKRRKGGGRKRRKGGGRERREGEGGGRGGRERGEGRTKENQ